MAIHKKREDHFVSLYPFVYIISCLDSYLERILLPLRKTICFNTQTSRRSENTAFPGNTALHRATCFYGSRGIWVFPAGIKLLVFLLLCFWPQQNLEQTAGWSVLAHVCNFTICFASSIHQFLLLIISPITKYSYEKYAL